MALPYGFSVHHFVNSVGADAGFASIIGLALLVLLYFAHARETASLRDRLADSDARVDELEARVAHLMTLGRATAQGAQYGQPAPAPVPTAIPAANPIAAATAGAGPVPTVRRVTPAAAAASATGAAAGAVASGASALAARIPSAPAGVAGPALAAATRLIPGPTPLGSVAAAAPMPATAAAPESTSAPVAATTAAGVAAAAGAGATAAGTTAGATALADPPTAVDRGLGNGGPTVTAPRPAPAPAFSPAPQAPRGPLPPAPRKIQGRPSSGGARLAPPPSRPRGLAGRAAAFVAAAIAVVVIVVILLIVTSGGSSTKTASTVSTPVTNTPVVPRKPKPKAGAVNKANVVVSVLNGTVQNGLARTVLARLTSTGFKQGVAATSTSSNATATIVAYLPGKKAAALAVASALKLGPASVQPVDQSTQQVACPPGSPCTASVIVTVGADLQTTH